MQVLLAALQELTLKDDSGGVTGVRWTLSSLSTNVDEDRRTRRGGNVTLSDYLFRLPYADYHWDCLFSFYLNPFIRH